MLLWGSQLGNGEQQLSCEPCLKGGDFVSNEASCITINPIVCLHRACYQRRGQPALKRSGSDADQFVIDDLQHPSASDKVHGIGNIEIARNWVSPQVTFF